MIVLLKPKETNFNDNTKTTVHYKKKKKKSQSGTFSGQLNNTGIYNMDGNDKIIIGIIKLEFVLQKKRKKRKKEDKFEVPLWVKQEDIMCTSIFTDSLPSRLAARLIQ